MKISREWATPVTIGAFVLMAVTGVLMFFHSETGLNKLAHEWLGFVFVLGVALHAIVNWGAFKRYFVSSAAGRAVIALFAVALVASFAPLGGKAGGPPPILAMNAVLKAPLSTVAPLAGRPVEAIVAQLNGAGFAVSGPEASLASVARNREAQAKVMTLLFKSN
ncbi:hypothetical protein CCR94_19030 [Rhodoblastus sphagnicola]|uniref:Flavinylation-associated cytochrome domain-containing protein n=1 Tax=Rhodoblastus sphagnicola TaxID=333368 RepID=A0A2S6N031_9HYPH|nr:DUF4405 domain-containing protein [Rhodoblastus sphagnicola]MBB4197905.1 hypothetical protein [Rhodoblastus sphagnicola]PPQ27946.1 hypothetical protein CCR94_19030 [Rhodoblastus sphagnicola]